jgi:hypothetical protein
VVDAATSDALPDGLTTGDDALAMDAAVDGSATLEDASLVDAPDVDAIVDAGLGDDRDARGMDASATDDVAPLVPRCVPGMAVACACRDGASGAQTCRPDGVFDPCACDPPAVDAGAVDAGAPPRVLELATHLGSELASRFGSTCARRSDGSVYCWGSAFLGASGPEGSNLTPTRAMGLSNIVAFAGSLCAIRRDGAALCWAVNRAVPGYRESDFLPRVVAGASDVVAGTHFHYGSCFIPNRGAPLCYGARIPGPVPSVERWAEGEALTPLDHVAGAVQFAGNRETLCARYPSGVVTCWGYGDSRLGDGLTAREATCPSLHTVPPPRETPRVDCTATPVRVVGVSDAVSLVGGASGCCAYELHFCVLRAAGRVSCWGHNGAGQLGDGTIMSRPAPVEVAGVRDAVQISATDQSSCALLRDGQVMCWGSNRYSQLGDGRTDHGMRTVGYPVFDFSPTPVRVTGLARIIHISVSGAHACALQEGGRVFCWGDNSNGQLGDDSTASSNVPVEVVFR